MGHLFIHKCIKFQIYLFTDFILYSPPFISTNLFDHEFCYYIYIYILHLVICLCLTMLNEGVHLILYWWIYCWHLSAYLIVSVWVLHTGPAQAGKTDGVGVVDGGRWRGMCHGMCVKRSPDVTWPPLTPENHHLRNNVTSLCLSSAGSVSSLSVFMPMNP